MELDCCFRPYRSRRHRHDRFLDAAGRRKTVRSWLGHWSRHRRAAIVGSAIAASNDGYHYDGYRRCGWVRQFDAYGNYMGRVRTCNTDEWSDRRA
jgi:hypothetical protein